MEKKLARSLLEPRAIALIGASGDATKNTSRPQRFLRKHGYSGQIVPINPGRSDVLGEKAYPSLSAAPVKIDHALIMVPSNAVADAIADCCAAGVPIATIFSDGFADRGDEGLRRQRELVARANDAGVRILGPNSMGIINTHAPLALSASAVLEGMELRPGSWALVSQSGTMLGALLSRAQARGYGFSHLVSVGNEADLSVGEIVDMMVDDPNTSIILLFLETLRHSDRLAAAARRAFEKGKPVVAFKLGRSDIGRELAASHTGALAGPQQNVEAFFKHHGILQVEHLESLVEIPLMLENRRPPEGERKVAVVTTTGGGAAMVVDRLGTLGAEFARAPESLRAKLAEQFKIHVSASNVIDLTLAGTRQEVYSMALSDVVASPDCDAVVAVVGASGMFHPEHAVRPILAVTDKRKPIACFLAPQADESLRLLGEKGVAAFRTPEACADAINAYLNWTAPVAEPAIENDIAVRLRNAVARIDETQLDEVEAGEIFSLLGIPRAKGQVISNESQPVDVPFPVVLKIVSRDIPHKTEAGAVRVGIADAVDLRDQAAELLAKVRHARPAARISGLLVQQQETRLAEVIVGYKRDAEVGPIVLVGMGGVLAEIYRDVIVRPAPIDQAGALAMVQAVRGLAVIRGYRNMPEGDLDALADVICKMSRLAAEPRVLEAEINPLFVKPAKQGVVAVDGLILLSAASALRVAAAG